MPRRRIENINIRSKKDDGFCFAHRNLVLILAVLCATVLAAFWEMRIIYNMAREGSPERSDFGSQSTPGSIEERRRATRIIAREGLATRSDVGPRSALGETDEGRCLPPRELPDVPWGKPSMVDVRSNYPYEQCLRYDCERGNYERCDTAVPTDYGGPEPPCCVHILRDMARAFDDAMCELGFEYFASYGMLLGLVRSDRLIPWTSDNDVIVTKQTMSGIVALPPEEMAAFHKRGISLLFDYYYYRVCITPAFAEGKLAASWEAAEDEDDPEWYPLAYPYTDIFIAHEEEDLIEDELGCAHPSEMFRPPLRMGVYENDFHVSVPRDSEAVLTRVYGPLWRTPDANKEPHGNTKCLEKYKPNWQRPREQMTQSEKSDLRPALIFSSSTD